MPVYIHMPRHPGKAKRAHPEEKKDNEKSGIHAKCEAGDLLFNELKRYCHEHVAGRSVLLAGLRGAGKTTLINSTLKELEAVDGALHPLRVDLLGPNLFADASSGGGQKRGSSSLAEGGEESLKDPDSRQRILVEVVLALYAALCEALVSGFRRKAEKETVPTRRSQIHELAATLEARLTEGPSLSELREYWRQVDALDHGVLFPAEEREGQGMLELVALAGLGYAYQRVSGDLKQESKENKSTQTHTERSKGWELKLADVVKPMTSLATGAAVAVAVAPKNLMLGLLSGAISALAAGAFFKFSTSRTEKREEVHDRTFLPDTSAETLDRVLPTLVDRLKRAGLAPVVIIDELDKVDDLWTRHHHMISHMKKLFAENVFTCSLVNRSFMEELHHVEATEPYGNSFSYFTHRSYVAFSTVQMHDYLDQVIEVKA